MLSPPQGFGEAADVFESFVPNAAIVHTGSSSRSCGQLFVYPCRNTEAGKQEKQGLSAPASPVALMCLALSSCPCSEQVSAVGFATANVLSCQKQENLLIETLYTLVLQVGNVLQQAMPSGQRGWDNLAATFTIIEPC